LIFFLKAKEAYEIWFNLAEEKLPHLKREKEEKEMKRNASKNTSTTIFHPQLRTLKKRFVGGTESIVRLFQTRATSKSPEEKKEKYSDEEKGDEVIDILPHPSNPKKPSSISVRKVIIFLFFSLLFLVVWLQFSNKK